MPRGAKYETHQTIDGEQLHECPLCGLVQVEKEKIETNHTRTRYKCLNCRYGYSVPR